MTGHKARFRFFMAKEL